MPKTRDKNDDKYRSYFKGEKIMKYVMKILKVVLLASILQANMPEEGSGNNFVDFKTKDIHLINRDNEVNIFKITIN